MSCWCAPHSRGTRSWRGSPRSTAVPGTTPSSPMGACWSGTCATHRPIPPGGRPRSPRRGARGGRLAVDDPTTSAASARWSSTSTASRSAAGGPRGAPRVRRGPDTACLCAEALPATSCAASIVFGQVAKCRKQGSCARLGDFVNNADKVMAEHLQHGQPATCSLNFRLMADSTRPFVVLSGI